MKKLLKIIPVLLILSVLLSSCSIGETELKNRLIIEGIGVDYDSEKDEYDITVQVLGSGQSGSEGSQEPQYVNYKTKGKTIVSGINLLCAVTGREPLYNQNRIIVLGSSLSGKQIIASLDYFVREYTSRADVTVAVAMGKASEILENDDKTGEIPAIKIEKAITSGYENSVCVDTELYNIVNIYSDETTVPVMPLLKLTDGTGDAKTITASGSYVFDTAKPNNFLSDDGTMALRFAEGSIESGTFNVTSESIKIGFDIISSKTKKKLKSDGDKLKISLDIDLTADIIEYESSDFGSIKKEEIKKIQEAAQKYIEDAVKNIINKEFIEKENDIFRFGKMIMLKQPKKYKEIVKNGKINAENIEFTVKAKCTVRRIGQETMK